MLYLFRYERYHGITSEQRATGDATSTSALLVEQEREPIVASSPRESPPRELAATSSTTTTVNKRPSAQQPAFLRANFETAENNPGSVIIGGNDKFAMTISEYSRMVALSKSGSALVLKILRHYMSPAELKKYSWRGTKTRDGTGKESISENELLVAAVEQAKIQFPGFEITESFKKSVSTACAGNH